MVSDSMGQAAAFSLLPTWHVLYISQGACVNCQPFLLLTFRYGPLII